MNYYEFVGKELHDQRRKANLTQQEVADVVCISCQVLNLYETGRNKIKPEMFVRICQVLSTTPDKLLRLDTPDLTEEEFAEFM